MFDLIFPLLLVIAAYIAFAGFTSRQFIKIRDLLASAHDAAARRESTLFLELRAIRSDSIETAVSDRFLRYQEHLQQVLDMQTVALGPQVLTLAPFQRTSLEGQTNLPIDQTMQLQGRLRAIVPLVTHPAKLRVLAVQVGTTHLLAGDRPLPLLRLGDAIFDHPFGAGETIRVTLENLSGHRVAVDLVALIEPRKEVRHVASR